MLPLPKNEREQALVEDHVRSISSAPRPGDHLYLGIAFASMKTHLGVLALLILLCSAVAQEIRQPSTIPQVSGASHSSKTAFSSKIALANTCPYVVTPVEIPQSTLEPLTASWKSLLSSAFSDPTYCT